MENGVYQKVRKLHGAFSLTKRLFYPYAATIHGERLSRSCHSDSLSGRPKHVIHAQGRWIIKTGTIETHGQRLYYESHGKGKPLLLVAGLGADITAWQLQIAPLSEHFQVIAFDNRDSGRSSRAVHFKIKRL